MEPSAALVAQLRKEKVDAARRMTPAEKFRAGADLFDYACEISAAGIRARHPDFDEAQVRKEIRRRLEIARRIEGAS